MRQSKTKPVYDNNNIVKHKNDKNVTTWQISKLKSDFGDDENHRGDFRFLEIRAIRSDVRKNGWGVR